MCEADWIGDIQRDRKLHNHLLEINQAVFYETHTIPMKYMLKKLGILARNEHRLPMVSASADLAERLDGVLERADLVGTAKLSCAS